MVESRNVSVLSTCIAIHDGALARAPMMLTMVRFVAAATSAEHHQPLRAVKTAATLL